MTTQQQSLILLIKEAHIPRFVMKLPERCGYNGVYYTIYGFQSHLPGKGNRSADFQSRNFNDRTECGLNPRVFQGIITIFSGEPNIDLFASYLNAKVQQYYSWKPGPGTMHIDAFTVSWHSGFAGKFILLALK